MKFREATIEDLDGINKLFLLIVKRGEFQDTLESAKKIVKDSKNSQFIDNRFRMVLRKQ